MSQVYILKYSAGLCYKYIPNGLFVSFCKYKTKGVRTVIFNIFLKINLYLH